jgi:hypothetical protein
MGRSIWYYVKRPLFTLGLILAEPHIRLYSIFVMDLIESDMIEYKPWSHMHDWRRWYIRGTNEEITKSNTIVYINSLLRSKETKITQSEAITEVKSKIQKHMSGLK